MSTPAIGVFDSGIGGLTVVKELAALLPHEKFIYFGDTARAPYGSRPPAQIIDFMHQILRCFASREVKLAVYACNTMTALGLEEARNRYSFSLVGMSTGVRTALKATVNKRIGVIATQATIASGKHGELLKLLDSEAVLYPQACPKFVPLIEQGEFTGSAIEAAALEYLAPLKAAKVDTIILGCTHYPIISPIIKEIMGPSVNLVDPAGETAVDARDTLIRMGLKAESGAGTVRIGFSGDSLRTEELAASILGDRKCECIQMNLEDYVVC
ncbi:MAG: murI [Firmicutes bacterium]|nr:murI [Bacillota bacterium]